MHPFSRRNLFPQESKSQWQLCQMFVQTIVGWERVFLLVVFSSVFCHTILSWDFARKAKFPRLRSNFLQCGRVSQLINIYIWRSKSVDWHLNIAEFVSWLTLKSELSESHQTDFHASMWRLLSLRSWWRFSRTETISLQLIVDQKSLCVTFFFIV